MATIDTDCCWLALHICACRRRYEGIMEIQEERKPKNLIAKTIAYCRKNGLKKCEKIYLKFFRLEEVSYRQWQKGALPTAKDLEKQRGHKFDYEPLISVVFRCTRHPYSSPAR